MPGSSAVYAGGASRRLTLLENGLKEESTRQDHVLLPLHDLSSSVGLIRGDQLVTHPGPRSSQVCVYPPVYLLENGGEPSGSPVPSR